MCIYRYIILFTNSSIGVNCGRTLVFMSEFKIRVRDHLFSTKIDVLNEPFSKKLNFKNFHTII